MYPGALRKATIKSLVVFRWTKVLTNSFPGMTKDMSARQKMGMLLRPLRGITNEYAYYSQF
jgi:hypothetical protein